MTLRAFAGLGALLPLVSHSASIAELRRNAIARPSRALIGVVFSASQAASLYFLILIDSAKASRFARGHYL